MATAEFHLNIDFKPYDLITWHRDTEPGDIAVITLPNRTCRVRLIRGYRDTLCWWPEGERSMTVAVENAIARLSMFQAGGM